MNKSEHFRWGDFIRLLICCIGIILSVTGMVGCFSMGTISLLLETMSIFDVFPIFSLGWISILVFLLLLPATWNLLMRLLARESRFRLVKSGIRLPNLLLFFIPLLVIAGDNLSRQQDMLWLMLLPPIQLLVLAVPLWWLVEFGRLGLARDGDREWDILGFSIVITQPVAVLAEIVLCLFIFVIVFIWLTTRPDLLMQLQITSEQLMDPQLTTDMAMDYLLPYLQNPVVLAGLMLVLSLFIPIIEELIKPIGLYSMMSRKLTPADGFIAGLICGAVFALLESMGMLSASSGTEWKELVIARMGTGVLHSSASAIVGWGFISMWRGRAYARFIVSFFIAVLFHGLWNFMSLFVVVVPVLQQASTNKLFIENTDLTARIFFISLVAILLLVLGALNKHLRKEERRSSVMI